MSSLSDRVSEGVVSAVDEEIRFEPVGEEHAPALEELFARNAGSAVARSFDPFPLTREKAHQIATEPRRDGYYVLVGDGQLGGISMLRGADEGYEVPSFGIFIDQSMQGRGLGRRMTVWTLELARSEGAPAVRLSVYGENVRARKLYASLGFVEVESGPADSVGDREKIVMRLEFGS